VDEELSEDRRRRDPVAPAQDAGSARLKKKIKNNEPTKS
jgi:hypothetical protein